MVFPSPSFACVPNGVFARGIAPADTIERLTAKVRLRLGFAPVALFVGGRYPPNIEAVRFIRDRLAPACPDVTFAILGDAGSVLARAACTHPVPKSVRIARRVDDAAQRLWLKAADIGINLMFSGSGTNLKMLDYMAAGLPVVTTPFGARGIGFADLPTPTHADGLAAQITALAANRRKRARIGRRNRARVEHAFDRANISADLGTLLASRARNKGRPAPFFSVTVPRSIGPRSFVASSISWPCSAIVTSRFSSSTRATGPSR